MEVPGCPGIACEQVRVSLPHITAEFAAGRMSYARVRALTRIATPATEAGLAARPAEEHVSVSKVIRRAIGEYLRAS
jgi:hypothetical protein